MSDNTQSRNYLAAFYMLSAAVIYSLVPVILKWGDAHKFPFLFIAACQLVKCFVVAFILWCFFSEFTRAVKDIVKNNIFKGKIKIHAIIFVFTFYDYALFATATKFTSYAVVSVVFQISIILFVFYTSYLYKDMERYKFNISAAIFFMLLALGGFVFVLISQYKGDISFENYENLFYGGILALLAAIFVCFDAHGLFWATKMKDLYKKKDSTLSANAVNSEIFSNLNNEKKFRLIELLFVMILYGIGSGVALVFNVLMGIIVSEDIGKFAGHVMDGHWLPILSLGGLVVVAGVLWKASNLTTENLSINAISYLKPILTTICLWVLFGIDIDSPSLFIIGTIVIVVANLLINFAGEVRRSYKTLIISLWLFGTWTYIFPAEKVDIETYFQIIAVVATMYILLVSFRLDRLVRRTTTEEELSLELSKNILMMAWREVKTNKVRSKTHRFAVKLRRRLRELDSTDESVRLSEVYNNVKVEFRDFYKKTLDGQNSDDMQKLQMLHDMESDFNKYVHSKQQGYNFGEFMTLGILGLIIIAILMLAIPGNFTENMSDMGMPLTKFSLFSLNIFAMLISSTVIFLFFNIWDLQADRRERIMGTAKRGKKGNNIFGILFRDSQKRNFEQGLSIIVCVAIVLTFAGLFYDKQVMEGWFLAVLSYFK